MTPYTLRQADGPEPRGWWLCTPDDCAVAWYPTHFEAYMAWRRAEQARTGYANPGNPYDGTPVGPDWSGQ